MTLSAKIVNKLNDLYCSKAEAVVDDLTEQEYGIFCGKSDFQPDGDIRIWLLEYFKNFNEEQLTEKIKSFPCLKQIIYG
jgi:hypothetical protein